MLGSTVVLAVMTALAGHVSAQSCTVGQVYCGATLMRPPNFDYWKNETANASPNIPEGQRFDSIYRCTQANPGKLAFVEFCKTTPNRLCQPNNSGKCTGLNDCCAV